MNERATAGITVRSISFDYGATAVLANVDLEVARGEFFAFLGPSGSGKTTLLRLIAGFGIPTTGQILIGDRDVTSLPPAQRNVGMVFQNYALWPHMSVGENVAFGLDVRRIGRADRDARVRDALDMVGLGHLASRRPAQLSGGQQQRVALARTLVVRPDVLLLDEPLSNLDAKLRVEMRAELVALQRKTGLTTIYVTHDQEEANATADRMAVLDGGRVQQVGTPGELYDRPANRFVAGFLGTANLVPGHVVRRGTDLAFEAMGLSLPVTEGTPTGPSTLMIRPQSIAAEAARRPATAAIHARLARREFLGGSTRSFYQADGLILTVESPHRPGTTEAARVGSEAWLHIGPEDFTLLPA